MADKDNDEEIMIVEKWDNITVADKNNDDGFIIEELLERIFSDIASTIVICTNLKFLFSWRQGVTP